MCKWMIERHNFLAVILAKLNQNAATLYSPYRLIVVIEVNIKRQRNLCALIARLSTH